MSEKERKERREKDTDRLYRSVGKFVVEFEHVCSALQAGIVFILHRSGLHDQNISQILLAGINADPLRTLFESLVNETQSLSKTDTKILKSTLNRFQRLTEQRNNVVHSVWFIGWGNDSTEDFSEASGIKYHKNKKGADVKTFRQKAEDFNNLIQEAEALTKIFQRMHGCILDGHSFQSNIKISDDGTVSVPDGSE